MKKILLGLLIIGISYPIYASWGKSDKSDDSDKKSMADVLYEQATKKIESKEYEMALKLLKKAHKKDKKNAEVLNLLAFSQRKLGKLDTAIKNYYKALKIKPRFPEAREYLGEAYIMKIMKQIKTLESYGQEGEEARKELVEAFKKAANELE